MKMKMFLRKNKIGFTLAEVMTVIVILGVLAALALPNFQIQMMKVKNQEAIQVLLALYGAQKDYAKENDDGIDPPDYDSDGTKLDIDIPTMKNFGYSSFLGEINCGNGGRTYVASVISNSDPKYILYVLADDALDNGTIVCSNSDGTSCPDSLCTKMGFR